MASPTHTFFLDKPRQDGTCHVLMRLTYLRKHRYVGTSVAVADRYFNPNYDDTKANWISKSHPDADLHNGLLREFHKRFVRAKSDLVATADTAPFTVEDLKKAVESPNDGSLSELIETAIATFRERKQWAMASTRQTVLNNLRAFLKLKDTDPVPFNRLTRASLDKFETYLMTKELPFNRRTTTAKRRNTATAYLGVLRGFLTAYVIQHKLQDSQHPMRGWELPTENTQAEALTSEEIRTLLDLTLPQETARTRYTLAAVRDFYCCSFGLHGIRVGDLLIATRQQLSVDAAGTVWFHYVSEKRNLSKTLRVDPPFSDTLLRYADGKESSAYLFPFINRVKFLRLADKKQYEHLKMSIGWLNRRFREVATLAGITRHLTLHSARHSFGDDLLEETGDVRLVQDSFGHSDLQSTDRYTARRRASRVNKANVVYEKYAPKPAPKPTTPAPFGWQRVSLKTDKAET